MNCVDCYKPIEMTVHNKKRCPECAKANHLLVNRARYRHGGKLAQEHDRQIAWLKSKLLELQTDIERIKAQLHESH